ncbi:DUF3179 domain-containing protein [uncultured Dokdonia sp.]|uniref:DUF3179 domain-containing protein n=1 Tax=uncultured Dokdonia sp. TaxID=575653 RepID=UPI00260663CD|nr:DUF3179 domain-containing protein [uncultured Dokdonia sp.]
MLQRIKKVSLILFIGVLAGLATTSPLQAQEVLSDSEIHYFLNIVRTSSRAAQEKALKTIEKNWKPEFEIMALEVMYFGYSTDVGLKMALLLQKKTGQNFGLDFNKWYEYVWNKEQKILPDYDYFKSQLHKSLDPKFEQYFQGRQENSLIRLDEIRWGGVQQDGIPPLRNPTMIPANRANYLEDDHIVFGIEVNGDARAYPKRILAWHEMFVDEVGGIPVTGVYCTLCGTVILYKSDVNGTVHQMGTSGFLYRSNKLMYDQATQSLWSTLEGKPVVGPLVGKGIQMDYLSVVTTTWGEWKKRHPETQVLSLQTGYQRDYGEGVAYQAYFADDNLMFNVPTVDGKLKNKQSILAIRLPDYPEQPLAISVKYLKKNPVYQSTIGESRFVVFTDKTGANRVYDATHLNFKKYDQYTKATDIRGETWTVYEDRIENASGEIRPRIHTFNAFWFGWQAAYPDTKLVK